MNVFSAAFWGALSALILLLQVSSANGATEKVLYSFCSQQSCTDGEYPWAGVVRVKNELYATTTTGGDNGTNNGTLVAVNRKTGAAHVVYSFESVFGDAETVESDLIDVNGTLYGMSAGGGLGDGGNGAGTIYSPKPKNAI